MEVNGIFEPGMECYGIGIGSPVYVNAYLESIVEEIRGVADQTARTTGVFPQLDKTSCAWLMATPTLETYIPSTLFRKVIAAHLCLPSPSASLLSGSPPATTTPGQPRTCGRVGGRGHAL